MVMLDARSGTDHGRLRKLPLLEHIARFSDHILWYGIPDMSPSCPRLTNRAGKLAKKMPEHDGNSSIRRGYFGGMLHRLRIRRMGWVATREMTDYPSQVRVSLRQQPDLSG